MAINPFREAGLPQPLPDPQGGHQRYNQEIAVVRAVYPDIWCADIQPQRGGMLYRAQIADNVLPDVHIDDECPSYVEFWHRGGEMQDVWCRRVHWRRFRGPETAGEDEKRYYHKHLKIERVGDITVRFTPDNRVFLIDSEAGDLLEYDQNTREVKVIAPHVFLGTDDQTRIEYHRDEEIRLVIPKCFIGQTALQDQDGITYLQNNLLHLVSQVIKLTASSEIVLDPPNIKLGSNSASERALLGSLFATFWATVKAMIDGHVHSNVQVGGGVSGPPTTGFPAFTDSLLSDIVHISKS